MNKKIETVSHLKPFLGWNIDKVSESDVYENGHVSIPDVTYCVYAPGSEDCQNIGDSLESAKEFIREHSEKCVKHLYWVTYETGANRSPSITIVSGYTASGVVRKFKSNYYEHKEDRRHKVPFPFLAKAHRVPDDMTEEQAKKLAREFAWQRGIAPWDLCK